MLAAGNLALRDGARLTIVTVVALERPMRRVTRLPMLTSVWNDVLLDRARADLDRADRLLDAPARAHGAVRYPDQGARGGRRGVRLRRDHARGTSRLGGIAVCWTVAAHSACRTSPVWRSCARADGRLGKRDRVPVRIGNVHVTTPSIGLDRFGPIWWDPQPPCGCPTGPVTPHAAAACLNVGDSGSNPGMAGKSSPPLLGNVGSGKFGMPWSRRHLTCASAAMRCDSVSGFPVDLPPGCSRLQVCIADRKAGDCLIPEGNVRAWVGEVGHAVRAHAARELDGAPVCRLRSSCSEHSSSHSRRSRSRSRRR